MWLWHFMKFVRIHASISQGSPWRSVNLIFLKYREKDRGGERDRNKKVSRFICEKENGLQKLSSRHDFQVKANTSSWTNCVEWIRAIWLRVRIWPHSDLSSNIWERSFSIKAWVYTTACGSESMAKWNIIDESRDNLFPVYFVIVNK